MGDNIGAEYRFLLLFLDTIWEGKKTHIRICGAVEPWSGYMNQHESNRSPGGSIPPSRLGSSRTEPRGAEARISSLKRESSKGGDSHRERITMNAFNSQIRMHSVQILDSHRSEELITRNPDTLFRHSGPFAKFCNFVRLVWFLW